MAVKYDKNELINMIAKNSTSIKPSLMLSIADTESSLNPNATNNQSSAAGMYQMTDAAAKQFGLNNKFDPLQSTIAAQKYLTTALKRYNGDEDKAILSYYAGMGNVDKHGLDTAAMKLSPGYLEKVRKNQQKYLSYDNDSNSQSFDANNDTQIASSSSDSSNSKADSVLKRYGFDDNISTEDLEKKLGIYEEKDNSQKTDNLNPSNNSNNEQVKDTSKMTTEELERHLGLIDDNNEDTTKDSDNFVLPPDDFSNVDNETTTLADYNNSRNNAQSQNTTQQTQPQQVKVAVPKRPDFSNSFIKEGQENNNKTTVAPSPTSNKSQDTSGNVVVNDPNFPMSKGFNATNEEADKINKTLKDDRNLSDDQIFDMFKNNNYDLKWAVDNLSSSEQEKLVNNIAVKRLRDPEDAKKVKDENGKFKNFAMGTALGVKNLANSLYDNFALITNNPELKKDAEKQRKVIDLYGKINQASNPDNAIYNDAGQLTSDVAAGFAIPITRLGSLAKGSATVAKIVRGVEKIPGGSQLTHYVRNSDKMKKFGGYIEKGTNYGSDAALYSSIFGTVDTDGKTDVNALSDKIKSIGGDALLGGIIGVGGERLADTVFNKFNNWKTLRKAAADNNFPQEIKDKIKFLEDNGYEYNIAYFNDDRLMRPGIKEEIEHISRNDHKTNNLIDRNNERFKNKVDDVKAGLDLDSGKLYDNQKKKIDDLRQKAKSQSNDTVSNSVEDIEALTTSKASTDNNSLLKNDIALNYLNHKANSDELYKKADALVPNTDKKVKAQNTLDVIQGLIDKGKKSALGNSASDEALKAIAFNKQSTQKFANMGVGEFNETIKTLNKAIYDDKSISNTAKNSLTDIKTALMKDKDDFFTKIGGDSYLQAKKDADKYFSDNVASMRNDKQLKNMIDVRDKNGDLKTSDKIIDSFMTSGKADETRAFYDKLSPDGQQYFRQGAVDHLFNKSMTNGNIDIKKLDRNIEALNSKSSGVSPLDVVLTKVQKDNIKDLLTAYKNLQVAEANRLKSSTGKSVDQRIVDQNPLLKGAKVAAKTAALFGNATVGVVLGMGTEKFAQASRNKLVKQASNKENRHLFFKLANEPTYSDDWNKALEQILNKTNRVNSSKEEDEK